MSDEVLVKGLRAGDNRAYEALLDRHGDALYRFFYYSHGRHDLAEDQCGETFEALVRSISKMRSNNANSLKPFLFGIARNVVRRRRRTKGSVKNREVILEEIPDGRASVDRELAAREEWRRAVGAIEQFPDPQRQILLLRFVEGFKYEEIAEVMDVPVNSVRSHIHRGRQKLLEQLPANT